MSIRFSFILLLSLSNVVYPQRLYHESVSHAGLEYIVLEVHLEVGGKKGDANFIAFGSGSKLFYEWSKRVKDGIKSLNPYFLYFKGEQVGTFRVRDLIESEESVEISGSAQLKRGFRLNELDSTGQYSLTAISQKKAIEDLCPQPKGYDPEKFTLDFDCDGKVDLLWTKVEQTTGKIGLSLGKGGEEQIDSIRDINELLSIQIKDIFDIDDDGIPEILVSLNLSASSRLIIYKYDNNQWRRCYDVPGFGGY